MSIAPTSAKNGDFSFEVVNTSLYVLLIIPSLKYYSLINVSKFSPLTLNLLDFILRAAVDFINDTELAP